MLVGKKIKNVHQLGRLRAVDLGKSAAGTDYRGELLVLYVKYFGEITPGGPEYPGFKFAVVALGATPVLVMHIVSSSLQVQRIGIEFLIPFISHGFV